MSLPVAERSLEISANAIADVGGKRATLDDCLDRTAGSDCRNICTHLLMNYFRYKKSIDKRCFALISEKKTPAKVRSLILAALTRLWFQQRVNPASTVNVAVDCARKLGADKLVNAVLRRALSREYILPEKAEDILPDEVLSVWSKRFTKETMQQLAHLFVGKTPQSFRWCGKNQLPENAPAEEIPAFGNFHFFRTDEPEFFLNGGFIENGSVYWQDPAAAFAVSLPDYSADIDRAIDLCASPGGKMLMLREMLMPDAELIALDKSARRQELTRENCRRYNCRARVQVGDAGIVSGTFDLVLADVPCSNSGVFRRRPDVLWRFSASEVAAVNVEQKRILENAAKIVAPAGQLIYSTCSIEPEENGETVAWFLARHPEFELVKSGVLLPGEFSDGAGAALLRKKK